MNTTEKIKELLTSMGLDIPAQNANFDIDSVMYMMLVSELENAFCIRFRPEELTPELTLETLADLIESKISE